MTIHASGHPPEQALDALLAGYASGSLSAPLHALVAGHLELKPESRAFVRGLEAAGGKSLEDIPPVPIDGRDDKLKAIFGSSPAQPPGADRPTLLPYPLYRYLGRDLSDIPWKSLLPGMKQFKAEETERGEAVHYWIKRG